MNKKTGSINNIIGFLTPTSNKIRNKPKINIPKDALEPVDKIKNEDKNIIGTAKINFIFLLKINK
ncbi:hypothetical protein GCM10017554_28300 [Acinetobacter modestus]|nr:hypothetical protein GCM10017554_28300 [Acinetobacter modestus]